MVWWTISGWVAHFLLLAFTARVLYISGYYFYVFHIARRLQHTKDLKEYGKWAVITGATDGIGKGYAFAFARRGLNLVIFGRNEEKLKQVVDELKEIAPDSEIKTITLDFAKYDMQVFASRIEKELEGLDIGILVNNVGTMSPIPDGCRWYKLPPSPHVAADEIVKVNVHSMILMTGLVLPQMVEKGKGVIINLGSLSSIVPLPRQATYSATKGFVFAFTRSLQQDTRGTGVIVQHLQPAFVSTSIVPPSVSCLLPASIAPDSISYAEGSVDAIGLLDHSAGSFIHSLQVMFLWFIMVCIPFPLYDKLAQYGWGRMVNEGKELKGSSVSRSNSKKKK